MSHIARTTPADIHPNSPIVHTDPQCISVIFSPADGISTRQGSVLFGHPTANSLSWDVPEANLPDGSSLAVKISTGSIELLTDSVASRTIWYYSDDEMFIASSSQRLIACILGDFQFNERVPAWMLSSGTLGPGLAWDSRVRMLPPASRLTMNRQSWNLSLETDKPRFEPLAVSDSVHETRLREALLKSCSGGWIGNEGWILPLSGGVDSRGILLLALDGGHRPECITWGTTASLQDTKSDSVVAARLASKMGVSHSFLKTDWPDESVRSVLDRFLVAGEGRVDQLGGYTDGMRIWRDLHARGISGVLRGDEGFGWIPVHSETAALRSVGIVTIEDMPQSHPVRKFGLESQELFDDMHIGENESFSTYRDRLYHSFRIPNFISALNQIKSSYVEIATPLLNQEVLSVTRTMPDHLRNQKRSFNEIVDSMSPPIPYAENSSILSPTTFTTSSAFTDELMVELSGEHANTVLDSQGLSHLINILPATAIASQNSSNRSTRMRRLVRTIVPDRLRAFRHANRERPFNPPSPGVTALRAYIVSRMTSMLAEDARIGASR